MDKKFAIFDMDGTLIDSMPVWQNLAGEFLKRKGINNVPQSVMEKIVPMTLIESSQYFIDYFNLDVSCDQVVNEMVTIMDNHYKYDIELKAKVVSYLDMLKAKGVTMCVASSTNEKLMDKCLSRLQIKSYFEFLLSCETVKVGKNKPDVYLEAVKRLNATIDNTAVYEDAYFAMLTAKKAGFYVVAVKDDAEQTPQNVINQLADEVIDLY